MERKRSVGLSAEQWERLRAWACGVGGVTPPSLVDNDTRVTELAELLREAPAGSAMGSQTCEEPGLPFNPAGVHSYRNGQLPARLDELRHALDGSAKTEVQIHHSFVTLVPSSRRSSSFTC